MYDPGVDRHEWESEMQALEDQLAESPGEALPELEDLVARMLAGTGYDLADPVVREGEEREVVAEYLAAREITTLSERGDADLDPEDITTAIDGYRAIFDYIVATRSANADLET